MSVNHRARKLCGVNILALAVAATTAAQAQQSSRDASGEQPALEEVVVTARKRQERLIDVPIAISAFSKEQIESQGLFDLSVIDDFSPGMQYSEQGNVWAGRNFSQIFFRGMSVVGPVPKDQVGALFIDGMFFLGAASSINTMEVERVEVIRGPQSAYFGRNTFGGAVNYIMRTPGNEFRGDIQGEMTQRGRFKLSVGHEGPIIDDKLFYRVAASGYQKEGHYTANDSGELGGQETTSLTGTLYATPTERSSFKVRAMYSEDDDGAPQATYIRGTDVDTCRGNVPYNRFDIDGNPITVRPTNFICGTIPDMGAFGGDSFVSSNTSLASPLMAQLGLGNRLPDIVDDKNLDPHFPAATTDRIRDITRDLFDSVPDLDRLGLKREYLRLSAEGEVQVSDALTVSGNVGYNESELFTALDSDGMDLEGRYFMSPQTTEDLTAELRLTFDDGGKLDGLVGLSYYHQEFNGSFTGVMTVDPVRGGAVGVSGNSNGSRADVWGIFAAVNYDITDDLRLSLEGRYQEDEVTVTLNSPSRNTDTFSEFLPRVILSYQPGDQTNVYASYARGALPGQFNSALADPTIKESERQRLRDELGAEEVLDSEILDSYELGWKQRFLDGRAYLNVAGYFMDWSNQKLISSTLLQLVDDTISFRVVYVPLEIEIYGFELETGIQLTDNFRVDATLNYNQSEVLSGTDNFVTSIQQTQNIKGNALTRYPDSSGSLSAEYRAALSGDWDWFSRLDVSYTGSMFADTSNLAETDAFINANFRIGAEAGDLRLEAFVTNLTDQRNWANGARLVDLVNFRQGILMTAPDKREFGVRVRFSFLRRPVARMMCA